MFIYRNHIGGLFVTKKELSDEQRYCETCNDEDILLGYANNRKEALALLESHRYYGKDNEYIERFVNEFWFEKGEIPNE